MIFDSHVHTEFSTDSQLKIESALEAAKKLKLGIISTDHIDLNYPEKGKFIFDIDNYFNKYYKYRGDNYLIGVEIGMTEEYSDENRKINENYDFDYVIGSIHFVDGIDIYEKIYYKGKEKSSTYRRYFQAMINCIKTHEYVDSLAHIDYICRYATYEDSEIYYNEYAELIDEVLKFIIDKGIALEINSRRLDKAYIIKNLIPIYKRYREMGGNFVTIGSDAHYDKNIGMNIKEAFSIAEECNLRTVYYKNRKPEYM
ncbi:histidinol phosphate phosphatase [Clostridium guangxiense]|uniref:histidinol phosphate phosphatase n=1 Tax=Clostridium guangxiense TaxID=1662055 RepID=UPI001E2C6608|nr:histidinol phosphate phosphatase [Clostridium guangxiense]MCD2347695.1 histidinol phosphate phosphatase [Clostridium guangxiense]